MNKQAAYELGARLALQEANVSEEFYPQTKQAAYELGTRLALAEAGLLKEEPAKQTEKTAAEKPDVRAILASLKK